MGRYCPHGHDKMTFDNRPLFDVCGDDLSYFLSVVELRWLGIIGEPAGFTKNALEATASRLARRGIEYVPVDPRLPPFWIHGRDGIKEKPPNPKQ